MKLLASLVSHTEQITSQLRKMG